ncbi:MAG: hypothetical protein M3198_07300 [Actinomycetota bacterium]|nr:hypothetical protein [Actinomycetota bacterium]
MSSSAPAGADPSTQTEAVEQTRDLEALSAGTRVGGALIALGFLMGLVPGPIAAAIGAVALLSFGRSLAVATFREYLGLAAFGVVALAAAVGALRWGSSSLDDIRGAQAVLGATVIVDPQEAAIGAGLAAGAGVLALSLWLGSHRPRGLVSFALSCAEGLVVALLLVSAFWGPAVVGPSGADSGELAKDVGTWALASLAALLPAIGLSLLWRRLPVIWSWVAVLVAAAAAIAGTIVVPSFVAS